jgi:hypothetical protein
MKKQECDLLIKEYLDWLRGGLSAESLERGCEVTTPFLDRHNDHIQVYAEKKNGRIILSDDGYILSDLRTSGLELSTPKRKAIMNSVLNGFGVKIEGNDLRIEASQHNIGQRLHSLIQAMLAVNDMFLMAQPRVATFFWEDVKEYFDKKDVRYSPRVKLAGRSGFDQAIDFLIPKSKTRPERFVQAINVPSKSTIVNYLFALGDIREVREEHPVAYAFLNDQSREIGGDIIEALETYEVKPVAWSQRDQHIAELAA